MQGADHVDVTVINEGGETEACAAATPSAPMAAAAPCAARPDIEFEGFTWPERFIKIATSFDFAATGHGFCTRNYFSDPNEWLNLFKVIGNGPPGFWRGIMPVPAEESDEQALSMDGIQRRLQGIHSQARRLRNPVLTRSIPCISGWLRPSTRAACCSPATARMSTIPSAAWA